MTARKDGHFKDNTKVTLTVTIRKPKPMDDEEYAVFLADTMAVGDCISAYKEKWEHRADAIDALSKERHDEISKLMFREDVQ